jgi:catechol-2,3-dioxygenase
LSRNATIQSLFADLVKALAGNSPGPVCILNDHEPDVPISFYYFAFEAESPSALIDRRDELRANGINVIDIVDHQWSKSIYFKDPNCLSLEYCCAARSRTEEEAMPEPFTASHARRTGSDACLDQSQQHTQ